MIRRIYSSLILVVTLMFCSLNVMAEDIVISVSTKSPILPPQLLLYVSDPSQFFTVQLMNTTSQEQRIHLGLQMDHIMPNDGLSVLTPENYQPSRPFVVPANGTYSLTVSDMKNLFNHIPSNAMKIPEGLLDGYMNGSFGLLPEGEYTVKFSAYRWTGNNQDEPYLLSSAVGGMCQFTVCYNASAPTWLIPYAGMGGYEVCEFNKLSPTMTWTKPTLNCSDIFSYSYRVRIVEVLPFQQPDVAMDHNPVVYSTDVVAPMLTIPVNVLNTKFEEGKTYAAQITAKATNSTAMNYVQITNEGKSSLCLFRLTSNKVPQNLEEDEDEDELEDEEDEEEDPLLNGNFRFEMGDYEDSLYANTPYVFRNPDILQPLFDESEVRRVYTDLDIEVEWAGCWYEGGNAGKPDDVVKNYTVQLFNGKSNSKRSEVLSDEKNIIYTNDVHEATTETIPWDDIKEKVAVNDYLVLRVVPSCPGLAKGDVAFVDDSLNVRDFTLRDHIGPEYFQCSNSVELENLTPTTKTAAQLKGQEVTIGQYQLVLDQIEGDAETGFTGKGRVRWELPIGTAMVHVQFKNMKINNEDVVTAGVAESYKNPKKNLSDYEAVESIFTDLGIENMLASNGVPYANEITQGAKKTISEKVSGIADYYSLLKGMGSIWEMLVEGKETDIYMPICMPKDNKALKSLNSSPVDIQITTMKFAPTWATMDLLGEFTMPESECLATDILLFGAPRLCISPDNIIPEAGTLALLGDFTVKDTRSGFDCTFKAPTNTLEPRDGCYLAWKDHKFEIMGVDMDMHIPKLKKYDKKAQQVTEDLPKLHIAASVASWDDFMVDDVTIDPFEADALPGFTFECKGLSYDHSLVRNTLAMSAFEFPKGYSMAETVGNDMLSAHGRAAWQGLYAETIEVMMPKGLTSDGDDRLTFTVSDMLLDNSGVTLNASIKNLFEGNAGGFKVGIQEVGLGFVQSNFNNCYFDGSLTLPFLQTEDGADAKLGFNCQMRKQLNNSKKLTGEYAYIFNTRSLNGNYSLDLFLAQLKLDQKQTYFLLEAEPELVNGIAMAGTMKTRCELMMGGVIQIGGDGMRKQLKSSIPEGLDINIPDVHFVGMRVANCLPWKSKYVDFQADVESLRSDQKSNAKLYLTDGKMLHNGNKKDGSDANFVFHTGSWSLASKSKKIGPFEFTLEDFEFTNNTEGNDLKVGFGIKGKVALVKGIDISAAAHLVLNGVVHNAMSGEIGKMSVSFESPDLKEIVVHAAFCGFKLDGGVHFYKKGDTLPGDKTTEIGDGFFANIDLTLPGELFTVHGDGGYFDNDTGDEETSFSWGWLHCSLGSKQGLMLGPCKITKLGGGFYMNCRRNPQGDDKIALPTAGLVGVLLEVGMASADGSMIKGDLSLNVVYNRKRKCLSNFTMTGNVDAVGGIINANMTLVYENTPTDRYLQLNITADAQLSTESMAGALDNFASNLGTVKDMMQKLAGDKFKDLVSVCQGSLQETIGSDPINEDPKNDNKVDKDKVKKGVEAPKAGAKVSLDLKITWKGGGTEYQSPKWHVYLGEPDLKKRCEITLIDFKSPIVTCFIGANAYICVGNELPNDGQLPDIPVEISQFLDGSQHGEMRSDNLSDAQAARQRAMEGLGNSISGGVMLGASATGKLYVNLGIIKGNIDAILGFDISMAHYNNSFCANLDKEAGYNGWYGQGQLYAYLGLDLLLHFNLGFVEHEFTIASAGLGGVLKMGAPSPNYFQGKLRAKVELLGGLFKLDKSFEFDCGQVCQMFKGNPLDDFVLFDQCTLGDTIMAKGWISKSDLAKGDVITAGSQTYVKKNLPGGQYVTSQAGLDEHFRLLDENELQRIAQGFTPGSQEYNDFKMQAKRTFIFHDYDYALLFEYDDPKDYVKPKTPGVYDSYDFMYSKAASMCGAKKKYTIHFVNSGSSTRRYLNLSELRSSLKEGKYYRLCVIGNAKELSQGIEKDPYTVYKVNEQSKSGRRPWVKATNFFFMTAPSSAIEDKAPLQDYVAVAYPSEYNRLRSSDSNVDKNTGMIKHMPAYLSDVQSPTIALTEDLKSKAFKKGRLVWRLLNPMGQQIDYADNAWVTNTSGSSMMQNMEPAHKLNAQANEKYILQLDYLTNETVVKPDGTKLYNQACDTTLVRLYVETLASSETWRSVPSYGVTRPDYDKPFIAQKIVSAPMSHTSKSDTEMLDERHDAVTYISLLSNYVFPAGWQISQVKKFPVEVTTSESMIFLDPGHSGKYEGAYNDEIKTNVKDAYKAIEKKLVYVLSSNTSENPIQYPLSGYWHQGGEGASAKFDYVQDVNERITTYKPGNNYSYTVEEAFKNVSDTWTAAAKMQTALQTVSQNIEDLSKKFRRRKGDKGLSEGMSDYFNDKMSRSAFVDSLVEKIDKLWIPSHRGQYLTESGSFTTEVSDNILFIPAYQMPIVWAVSALEDAGDAYMGMSNSGPRAKDSGRIWGKFTGRQYIENHLTHYGTGNVVPALQVLYSNDRDMISSAKIQVYRVNSYDINNGHYTVVNNLFNGSDVHPYFNLNVTKPLLPSNNKNRTIEVEEIKALNTGSTTSGSVTGDTKNVKIEDSSTNKNINYEDMQTAVKTVRDKFKLVKSVYTDAKPIWQKYERCVTAISKNADDAEKFAINAAVEYVKANPNGSQQMYYKTKYDQAEKDVWRMKDSIDATYSKFTQQYSSIYTNVETINNTMASKITPFSDKSNKQYADLLAIQENANAMRSELKHWRDSVYNSINYQKRISQDVYEYGQTKAAIQQLSKAGQLRNNTNNDNKIQVNNWVRFSNSFQNTAATLQAQVRSNLKSAQDLMKKINEVFGMEEYKIENELKKLIPNKASITTFYAKMAQCEKDVQNVEGIGAKIDADILTIDKRRYELTGEDKPDGVDYDATGYLNMVEALFTSKCEPYSTISNNIKKVEASLKTAKDDRETYNNLLQNLPTAEKIEIVKEAVELRVDELNGRDRKKADEWLAKLENAIGDANKLLTPYKNEEDRMELANELKALNKKIRSEKTAYEKGDWVLLEKCYAHCQEFFQKLPNLDKWIADLNDAWDKISEMPDPIWTGLREAGYDDGHELYDHAVVKWVKEVNITDVKNWVSDLEASAKTIHGYENTLRKNMNAAKEVLDNPSDAFIEKCSYWAGNQLSYMRDNAMRNGALNAEKSKYITPIRTAVLAFGQAEKRAKEKWESFEKYQYEKNIDITFYTNTLQSVVSEATTAKEKLQFIETSRMNSCQELFMAWEDSIETAKRYVEAIPKDKSEFAERMYNFARQPLDLVLQLYGYAMALRSDTVPKYINNLTERYERKDGPRDLRERAQHQLDYIKANGKIDNNLTDKVRANKRRLLEIKDAMAAVETKVQTAYDAGEKIWSSNVGFYMDKLYTTWQEYENAPQNASTLSSRRSKLNNCIVYANSVVSNAYTMNGYPTANLQINVDAEFEEATELMDFIIDHYVPVEPDRVLAQKYYNALKKSYENIESCKIKAAEWSPARFTATANSYKTKAEKARTSIVETTANAYLQELKDYSNSADNYYTSCRSQYNGSNADISTLNANYTNVQTYYTRHRSNYYKSYSNAARQGYANTARTAINKVLSYTTTFISYYNYVKSRYDESYRKKTAATTALNFIKENCSSTSATYKSAVNYYDNFTSRLNSMSSYVTTLNTNKQTADSKMNSTKNTYKPYVDNVISRKTW